MEVQPDISLVISSIDDSGPGSLRAALAAASEGSTLTFDPSIGNQSISLEDAIWFNKDLVIDATDTEGLILGLTPLAGPGGKCGALKFDNRQVSVGLQVFLQAKTLCVTA